MADNTVANAWVQLMPSFRGGSRGIQDAMGGDLDRAGRDGGRRFGAGMGAAVGGMAAGIFAPLAAAAASVSLVGILKDGIEQASGLEEAGTKLNAIFGEDGAAAVQKFADTGAKALGQNKLAVLDSVATFGTMGKAAGLSGEGLAEFGNGFATLSTDLASFYNTSPEEAVEAIGSALRGEAEPIRKYGVLMDDASLKAEALAQGLITTTKDALTPQQKVLAAQGLIMKQTSDAQGDFERTSGGLANQQRILSASVTDLKGKLGEALLPAVTKVTSAIGGFISGMMDGTGAGGRFAGFIKGIGDFLRPIGTFLTGTVVPAVKGFFASLRSGGDTDGISQIGAVVTGTLMPAFRTFIAFVQANFLPAVQRIGEFFLSRIVPALRLVGQFVVSTILPALLSMGQTIAANVVPILQALWTQFQTNILPVLQKVFTVITGQVVPVLVKVGQAIVPVIAFFVKLAANILGVVIPAIINVAGPVIGFLINAIGNVIGWVARFVGWLVDAGKNIQTWARDVAARFMEFKDRAVAAFLELKARGEILFNAIKAFIVARIADVVGVASQIIAFKDRVVGGFTAMRDEVIGRITAFVGEVRAIPGKALEALGNMAATLRQKGKDLIQGLIDGITDKIQAVKNAISNVAGAIGDFFPGSPVKEGPLRKWNNGMAGKRLVGMLADGLSDTSAVESAARNLAVAAPGVPTAASAGAGSSGAAVFNIYDLDGVFIGAIKGVVASEGRRATLTAAQGGV